MSSSRMETKKLKRGDLFQAIYNYNTVVLVEKTLSKQKRLQLECLSEKKEEMFCKFHDEMRFAMKFTRRLVASHKSFISSGNMFKSESSSRETNARNTQNHKMQPIRLLFIGNCINCVSFRRQMLGSEPSVSGKKNGTTF